MRDPIAPDEADDQLDQAAIDADGPNLIDQVMGSRRQMFRIDRGVGRLTAAHVRSKKVIASIAVAVALSLVGVGFGGYGLWGLHEQNVQLTKNAAVLANVQRCLVIFAAATADRTGTLAPLSQDRQNALNSRGDAEVNLIISIIPRPGQTKAQQAALFQQLLENVKDAQTAYLNADRDYNEAAAAHPPPPPPTDTC